MPVNQVVQLSLLTRRTVVEVGRIRGVEVEDSGVERRPLLECCPYGSVQTILEIQIAFKLDDVRKQVAKESGVLGKQCLKVKGALRGDQLSESNLAGRQSRPFRHAEAMVGVWALVANCLEDHSLSILPLARSRDFGNRRPGSPGGATSGTRAVHEPAS